MRRGGVTTGYALLLIPGKCGGQPIPEAVEPNEIERRFGALGDFARFD